ncbi:hypothetical protein [Pseudomonas amygdali]|uniref:hypothetical protein n=1 Tax=Pseudomonas amygdali TaxID=47877 RepID=UPI00117BBD12|nr:hypothetical protein [Pseudomonas amygdali]
MSAERAKNVTFHTERPDMKILIFFQIAAWKAAQKKMITVRKSLHNLLEENSLQASSAYPVNGQTS